MKYSDVTAGLARWVPAPSSDTGYLEPSLPEEPGQVHAVPHTTLNARKLPRRGVRAQPQYLHTSDAERAACGKTVKVLLPIQFDDSDADVCPNCRREIELRAFDPKAWKSAQYAKSAERRRREERREAQREAQREIQIEADKRLREARRLLGDPDVRL